MTDERSYVGERVDALERSVCSLVLQVGDIRHELMLIPSVLRTCADIDARIIKLEQQYAELLARVSRVLGE